MDAVLGAVLFILGGGLVGLCLIAIPGPGGEGAPPPSHGHH
jgi:hypothetical protein